MWLLLTALAAQATTCSSRPPPYVMGGTEEIALPTGAVVQISWRSTPATWPPVLVLSDATDEHEFDLHGHTAIPLVLVDAGAPSSGSNGVSIRAKLVERLPVGSTWRLYQSYPDLGWLSWTRVLIVEDVPEPLWLHPPVVRTGLAGLSEFSPGYSSFNLNFMYRSGVTGLLVQPEATTADFLAVWAGRDGSPINYDRPPDFIASRRSDGFQIGSVQLCEPVLLTVPDRGGDDLIYGIRPVDTRGRQGPPVEVSLPEARRQEALLREAALNAASQTCRESASSAQEKWRNAKDRAIESLSATLSGCVPFIAADELRPEFRFCGGRPEYERAKAVAAIDAALHQARTLGEVRRALEAGSQLPPAWRADTSRALEDCRALPESAAQTPR
jgi:hypothetical protein